MKKILKNKTSNSEISWVQRALGTIGEAFPMNVGGPHGNARQTKNHGQNFTFGAKYYGSQLQLFPQATELAELNEKNQL